MHTPRSVLVTGGAGFIGTNYLLHMVPRYPNVRFVNLDLLTYAGNLTNLEAISNAENYAFVKGDIADRPLVGELFATYGFTTVVHFAAESHVDRSIDDPLSFVRTNVLGTATLLDEARRRWNREDETGRYRFHHISTDEVFGSLKTKGYFDETTPYDPRSPYSASKASADHLVRAYAHTYGLPVVLSNCSNNYGPYQFPEKLIPLMVANGLEGKPLPVYGRGENVRDWIHVSDHCRALEVIMRRGASGETYTVGGRCEQSNLSIVEHLADLIDEFTGKSPGTTRRRITFIADRPGHDYRYAIDCTKIEDELGWAPVYSLDRGLRETVRWYMEHRAWLEAVRDASYRSYYDKHYGATDADRAPPLQEKKS